MHRKALAAALVVALSVSAPVQASHAQDALASLDLGARFCSFVQDGEPSIAPGTPLTASLAATVSQALARNDVLQLAAPDEKPPLGDGIPWTSWPDRPDACTIGAASIAGDQATLPITYGFTDAPDATYTDTLVLRREAGAWRIDDVILIDDQRLRTVIETVFAP